MKEIMKEIIEKIREKLSENAGELGIVPGEAGESRLTVSFKNKKKITLKNLQKLTGIICEALTASGVRQADIQEFELRVKFFARTDEEVRIILSLNGKGLKIEIQK